MLLFRSKHYPEGAAPYMGLCKSMSKVCDHFAVYSLSIEPGTPHFPDAGSLQQRSSGGVSWASSLKIEIENCFEA